MEALIYIEVLNELEHQFIKPRFEELKKQYPHHEALELDNHSDDKMIEHVKLLISESDQIHLVFDNKQKNAPLNKCLSLFSVLRDCSSKVSIKIEGEPHQQLSILRKQLTK